jgi:cobalamin biosynthetic protein CobC
MRDGGIKRLHGGDLSDLNKNTVSFIDLSTGINPNAYPWWDYIDQHEIKALSHDLPQSRMSNACMDVFYGYAEVRVRNDWYMGSGTQALIEWVPTLFEPMRVMIASPTYFEHEVSWRNAGHSVTPIKLGWFDPEEIEDASVLVITNPNNPDGKLIKPDMLLKWAVSMQKKDSVLVVDEAFIDLTPDQSLCRYDLPENIIIFRSFGKFFGLAGMRLGFVRVSDFCPHIKPFEDALWPVSGLTMRAAALAMADKVWIEDTLRDLKKQITRMKSILLQSEFSLVGGTDLYQLVSASGSTSAAEWYQRLLDAGIYVRRFDYAPTWLRFGLPAGETEWQYVEKALLGT